MKSAFLMHPLDASYVKRSWHMGTKLWGSLLPEKVIEKLILHIAPFIQREFEIGTHKSMIVICPLTSRQMMTLPKSKVIGKLRNACNLAYKNGARIISLGAYSAIATSQGKDLVGKTKIGLTTGRAYTVYAVMEQARRVVDPKAKIAIVGGDGAIGSAVTKLSKEYNITKIGRNNIKEVYHNDLIISATSKINEAIDIDRLKKGTIVIDAAKPSDISRRSKEIKVIDGGLVRVPGEVDFGIDFDCPENTAYACMAEAFILGIAGKGKNFCIGKDIDLRLVQKIGKLGDKFGFKVI